MTDLFDKTIENNLKASNLILIQRSIIVDSFVLEILSENLIEKGVSLIKRSFHKRCRATLILKLW
jgi:hypothetical protein